MRNSRFIDCNFSGAIFSNDYELTDVTFENSTANWNSLFDDKNFRNVKFTSVNLIYCKFKGIHSSSLEISDSNFYWSGFDTCVFYYSDISSSTFDFLSNEFYSSGKIGNIFSACKFDGVNFSSVSFFDHYGFHSIDDTPFLSESREINGFSYPSRKNSFLSCYSNGELISPHGAGMEWRNDNNIIFY